MGRKRTETASGFRGLSCDLDCLTLPIQLHMHHIQLQDICHVQTLFIEHALYLMQSSPKPYEVITINPILQKGKQAQKSCDLL